jgi:hypothetical protein
MHYLLQMVRLVRQVPQALRVRLAQPVLKVMLVLQEQLAQKAILVRQVQRVLRESQV